MVKLFSKFDFCSLRTRTFLWALVFVLPILALFIYSTNLATRSYEDQMQDNLQQILRPYAREVDVTLDNSMRYIANKRIDMNALDASDGDELAALTALRSIGDGFSDDLSIHSQVDSIFLYHRGEILFVQNYNRSYAKQRKAADYLAEFFASYQGSIPYFQQGYQHFACDGVYYIFIAVNLDDDNVLGCWFGIDTLLEPLRTSQFDGLSLALFADPAGNLLHEQYNIRSNRRLSEMLSGYLVLDEQLTSAPFTLKALLEKDLVLAPMNQLSYVIFLALVVAFVLFIIYIGFMRGSVIRPLNRLVSSIQKIRDGNFEPIVIRKNDATEIQAVYDALNKMTNEVSALKIRIYEEKLMQQNTQMQLFQLQIRPHFFINALNSILSYARANDYVMLQKMTLGLATHCRYILYKPWFVSVEEELAYTQNYINMQSMQHDTHYRYTAEVEDALLDHEIPILAVQIFVENALKHSRSKKEAIEIATQITQGCAKNSPYLLIVIDDTGDGFDGDMLVSLNGEQTTTAQNRDHGIGIENVRRRLDLLYGDEATIVFSNNESGGAHVEMRLPTQRKRGITS